MQDQISTLISEHPAWRHKSDQLIGEWQVGDFAALRAIVAQLCVLADELNHHPTVTYGYNTLRIETTTHDAGNVVTELDIKLAKRVSEMVGE